jgi:hypothetical protein
MRIWRNFLWSQAQPLILRLQKDMVNQNFNQLDRTSILRQGKLTSCILYSLTDCSHLPEDPFEIYLTLIEIMCSITTKHIWLHESFALISELASSAPRSTLEFHTQLLRKESRGWPKPTKPLNICTCLYGQLVFKEMVNLSRALYPLQYVCRALCDWRVASSKQKWLTNFTVVSTQENSFSCCSRAMVKAIFKNSEERKSRRSSFS